MKKVNGMLLFWRGIYSQWHMSSFIENDITFKSAEHYMMYHKAKLFGDNYTGERILIAKTPRDAKALGRIVKNFDNEVWDKNCIDIVSEGSYLKFTQNKDLKKQMIEDKDFELVEASPYDKIWGIGLSEDDPRAHDKSTWEGTNYLGIALMNARERILKESIGTW